ncbi:MAG: LysR family transcriptional regulator [Actinomycetota bacterium]|nr:LysR family transcriptional regulator [Actinomycetota bacterium]
MYTSGMGHRRLANLDLNLLVSLDALLVERNVTRAAGRLGVTQPTVSAALARLRRHFGDELLARVGNRYELTPLALRLIDPISTVLDGAERVFAAAPGFDPSTSEHEFRLALSDYAIEIIGPSLSRALADRAPGIRLVLQPPSDVSSGQEALRAVDGLLLPRGYLTDAPHVDLYSDSWVLVVSADNAVVGTEIDLADLGTMPWVMTHYRPPVATTAALQLNLLGIEPRVEVVVENFLAIPAMVSGTRRVALLQSRLATRWASHRDLRVLACPFDAGRLVEALWWHPAHNTDPAHAWLRNLLVDLARDLPETEVVPAP